MRAPILCWIALVVAAQPCWPGSEKRVYELAGTLVAADGSHAGAGSPFVTITDVSSSYAARTQADHKGRFKFKSLAPGLYNLVAFVPRVSAVRKTVEVGPSFADSRGRVAVTMVWQRRTAGRSFAVPATQLAVPEAAQEEYRKALQYLQKRDRERAQSALERAVQIAPHFSAAWSSLGNIAYRSGQLDEAVRCFRESITQNPNNFGALINLGGALLAQGNAQSALEATLRAARLRPDHPLAEGQLGYCYFALGQLEDAETHLKKTKELDPAHQSFPQLILAEIYGRRRDLTAFAGELEEFVKLHPDSDRAVVVRKYLDWARQELQHPSGAIPP